MCICIAMCEVERNWVILVPAHNEYGNGTGMCGAEASCTFICKGVFVVVVF